MEYAIYKMANDFSYHLREMPQSSFETLLVYAFFLALIIRLQFKDMKSMGITMAWVLLLPVFLYQGLHETPLINPIKPWAYLIYEFCRNAIFILGLGFIGTGIGLFAGSQLSKKINNLEVINKSLLGLMGITIFGYIIYYIYNFA